MKLHAFIAFVVAAIVGGLVFVFVEVGGSSPQPIRVGTPRAEACTEESPACLPELTMTDTDGHDWRPEDLRGKVVLVNVWATWCHPCQAELPELVELRRRYSKDDLLIFGVLTDDPGDDALGAFVDRYHINYPIVPITGALDEALASPSGLPTSFLYDRQGRLVRRKLGGITADGMAAAMQGL